MYKQKNKQRGITLIALVVSIIVLIILAGVSIAMLVGENGIITQAQRAAQETEQAQVEEKKQLAMLEAAMNAESQPYTDKNGDTATIPAGFAVSQVEGENTIDDGLVIIDKNGNEFVWIPVDGMDYDYNRYIFSGQSFGGLDSNTNSQKIIPVSGASDYYTEALSSEEALSVQTYGGYYIARYESGILEEIERTDIDKGSLSNTLVVQENKNIYNFVTIDDAITLSNNLYAANDKIISKLCSSYAWDTALKFIETSFSSYPTNSVGGNYNQESGGTGILQKTRIL